MSLTTKDVEGYMHRRKKGRQPPRAVGVDTPKGDPLFATTARRGRRQILARRRRKT